jgi:tRNA nucleotidyltransferase (CCA-adding enzyme)
MKPVNHSTLRDDPLLRRVWEQLGRPSCCCVTGGYVRDRLLGRVSNDLDLTLDGNVDETGGPANRLARAFGVRAHLLGTPPHRIWRIESHTFKIELWPLGGLSHEEDIRRRDFSCNALSWELPDGPLVDLVGGIEDLERRRLRAISCANLEDDPVRLLRGPRFLAQLPDFGLDDQTRSWIDELAPSLAGAPRERVGIELVTLLRGPAASRGLAECLSLGLLGPVSPAADKADGDWLTANLDAADALTLRSTPVRQQAEVHCGAGVPPAGRRSGDGGSRRHPLPSAVQHVGDAARLGFLFRAWGIPTGGQLARYAWPRADRENALRAARLLNAAHSMVNAPPADRRELSWRAGRAFPALIALSSALDPEHPGWHRWWRQWLHDPAAFEDPNPLLSGSEIAEITGIEPGPELGDVVKALKRALVRGEIRSRGGALKWLGAKRPSRVLRSGAARDLESQ